MLPRRLFSEFRRLDDLLEGEDIVPLRNEVAGERAVGVSSTDSATSNGRSLQSEVERCLTGAGQLIDNGFREPARKERGDVGGEESHSGGFTCPEEKGVLEDTWEEEFEE